MKLRALLKKSYFLYYLYHTVLYTIPARLFGERWDRYMIRRGFRKTFGREPNLEDPQTMNEKIQWLKLHERDDFQTLCADKLTSREVWRQYGEEGLVPLLYQTDNWRDITRENLPDVPCIVKCSTGSGYTMIVRDKNTVDMKELRLRCRKWLVGNYYYESQEWQYKNAKSMLIVEQLLLDKNGHIPNDYKLHFFNGTLQFVYCSIDREGDNYRNIYSPQWERMDMEWVRKKDFKGTAWKDIPRPATFDRMLEIGADIAKHFKYVRVDFYDVDGKLYYGEITLHHGSGYDSFRPEEYDLYYGQLLKL